MSDDTQILDSEISDAPFFIEERAQAWRDRKNPTPDDMFRVIVQLMWERNLAWTQAAVSQSTAESVARDANELLERFGHELLEENQRVKKDGIERIRAAAEVIQNGAK